MNTNKYLEAFEFGFSPMPIKGKIPIMKSYNDKPNDYFLGPLEKHSGNVGIRCGSPSKIIILDCDKPRANNPSATDGNKDFNQIVLKETTFKSVTSRARAACAYLTPQHQLQR
jgi:hypothetical protein